MYDGPLINRNTLQVPSVNICVVNTFFPPHVSGTARAAFLLSNELSKRGHRVVVITSSTSVAPTIDRFNGVTVYRLRSVRYPELHLLHRAELYCNLLPGNLGTIVDILKKHKIDVVQTYGQFFDLTIIAVAASRMLGIPVVLTIGTRLEHPRARLYDTLFLLADRILIKRVVAHRVDRIVAPDKLMKDYIIKRYCVNKQFIRFIPTGVDINRFDKLEGRPIRKKYCVDDEDPLVLSLGTISNLRSPRSLIKAVPRVLKEFPSSKLLFVGAVYSTEAMHMVKKLGLEDSVIFCGKVEYTMVPSYLGACDVEGHDLESGLGIGLASLEAMAAGKPVLSSARQDNFIDLRLENWKNIVLVRPGHVEDISSALLRLLSDRRLREDIGENARKFIREHFSLDSECGKYETVYREIGAELSQPDSKTSSHQENSRS